MQKKIAVVILLLCPLALSDAKGQNHDTLILPNANLLRCNSSDCFRLWSGATEQQGLFPKQMTIDMDRGCVYGMTALYDKAVPFDRVDAAINDRYRQWFSADGSTAVLHLWRVEAQKFAIQLHLADTKDEKRNLAEAGTKQVIYIAFGGRAACNPPHE